MDKETLDFYSRQSVEDRLDMCEELRELYTHLHRPFQKRIIKGFKSWKEYIYWKKKQK